MQLIGSEDISVVVQGAIDKVNTHLCLKSIHIRLPKSEIILSTWEGSDVGCLSYDSLVENKDPGSYSIASIGFNYNLNRQIISTLEGIKKSKRKFVFKIRSDVKITNTNFLHYFYKYQKRINEYKILSRRVLINSLFCTNPRKSNEMFHISDWCFFGLKEDVFNIFDIPLWSENNTRSFRNMEMGIKNYQIPEYSPEQHIWIEFLKKNLPLFTPPPPMRTHIT